MPHVTAYCLETNSVLQTLQFDAYLEPLKFLGKSDGSVTFLIWDTQKRTVGIFPQNMTSQAVQCESKPYSICNIGLIVAFAEKPGKVSIKDFCSNLEIQVFPEHHGLSTVDKIIIFYPDFSRRRPVNAPPKSRRKVWKATGERFLMALFDYIDKKLVLSSFSVESLFALDWRVLKIMQIGIAVDEQITSVQEEPSGHVKISTTSKKFHCKLPFFHNNNENVVDPFEEISRFFHTECWETKYSTDQYQ